jgi:hypothetical protein
LDTLKRLVPEILTRVLVGPRAGLKLSMSGSTAKMLGAIKRPPGAVRVMSPEVALEGTVARI